MSDNTPIEWTDATWNIITGCTVHSPGCTNCYAMKLAGSGRAISLHPSRAGLTKPSKAGPVWTGEVRFNEARFTQPLKWRKPRKIFVCAHGDLFHEAVPDEWIDQVFTVMALCPQHTFQVLTKRSARMREYVSSLDQAICRAFTPPHQHPSLDDRHAMFFAVIAPKPIAEWPLPNVWLGISVEDQTRADERIPDLLATPAAVRWISAEPLLGPVDLREVCNGHYFTNPLTGQRWHDAPEGVASASDMNGAKLDWVVVGGESGPDARPMHPDWASSLHDQCAAAGVPFLFKQWGEWAPGEAFGATTWGPVAQKNGGGGNWLRQYVVCGDDRADRLNAHSFDDHATNLVFQVGKKRAGRLLDGVMHDGFPG